MNYLRFYDLKQRNIVRNWTTLTRLMREQGFPAGTRVGAQARAWAEDEVAAWLERRRIAAPQELAQEPAPEPVPEPVQKATQVAAKSSAAVQHNYQSRVRPPPSPRARPTAKPDVLENNRR